MLFLFLLGLQFLRDKHDLFKDLLKGHDLNPQVIFLSQVPNLIITVVAGTNDDLGPGGLDLIGLYLSGLHAAPLKGRPHGNGPAAAGTAVIVVSMRFHFPEIFGNVTDDIAGLIGQPPAAGNIAGVLIGDGIFELMIKLQPAITNIFGKKFYTVYHLKRIIRVQPDWPFKLNGPVGVASLGYGDTLDLQVLGRLFN